MTQIKHQLLYRFQKTKNLNDYKKLYNFKEIVFLDFNNSPYVYNTYLGNNKFTFLNIKHNFGQEIDWNHQEYGKLWNYNLQYANYVMQEEISVDEKIRLINHLYEALVSNKLLLEPYPASLRVINIIRLFSYKKLNDANIQKNVYGELQFLSERPEYHLLGNHLLENAFALLMGGAFFSNNDWIAQGEKILLEQLDEQILKDGAHFELSPMYHKIILFRMLELIDWYGKYQSHKSTFLQFLILKTEKMCSWLENITFQNGDVPHFNDSAIDISYNSKWLIDYARSLDITWENYPLGESGYRSKNTKVYECRVDFAQIGPSYQPGHAHADALSFILYHNDIPVFVEQGTSTYDIGERRNLERSTSAHNTVVVNNQNQSEVWSGFRVARRATTTITNDAEDNIAAYHDGYKKLGVKHYRAFKFKPDNITILDSLLKKIDGVFYLHLHPNCTIVQRSSTIFEINSSIKIEFIGSKKVAIEEYLYAYGFNKYLKSNRLIICFEDSLKTFISFN
tara:strand:+ start:16387 stop:17913 length:1527 start_codon:yes stop_codon:yes gene_type:complete